MLPSGQTAPAAWLKGRWWERNQEINPVASQGTGSSPCWPAPRPDPHEGERPDRRLPKGVDQSSAGATFNNRDCSARLRASSTPTASSPRALATAGIVPTPQKGSTITRAPT